MNSSWPLTPLGKLLKPIQRSVSVEQCNEYKLLGVRLDSAGPFLREIKLGSEISANKLCKVQEGDFIYSRLFAWRGAFGIINKDLNDCFVSNEFPIFLPIKDKLDIRFLNYWFRLRHVLTAVEADCSGSTPLTRNRYKEEFFLQLEIPLPPFGEQQRIVAKIERLTAKIDEIKKLQDIIRENNHNLLSVIFEEITKNATFCSMNDIAPLVRRPVKIDYNDKYLELGIRSFGKGTFHKAPLLGSDVGTKKIYWIETGDLIFSNVFAWEGAIAVAREIDSGRVGSHRFITRLPRKNIATSEFLKFYFLTNEGLGKIKQASPGGAGRNRTLGLKKLDKITVPLPNIKDQKYFDSFQYKFAKIEAEYKKITTELDALLSSILDRAFQGKL